MCCPPRQGGIFCWGGMLGLGGDTKPLPELVIREEQGETYGEVEQKKEEDEEGEAERAR